jgi:hypothetical protein
MNDSKCVICGDTSYVSPRESACADCSVRYPAPLVKACCDPRWAYALGLRNGKTFLFSGARIVGDWAYLQTDSTFVPANILPGVGIDARRGVAVRVNDIMWCLEGGH